jgi:hypothetical protein
MPEVNQPDPVTVRATTIKGAAAAMISEIVNDQRGENQ